MKRVWHVAAWSLAGTALLLGAACLGAGCSSLGYLAQSAAGHLDLVARARPFEAVRADAATPEALRERLALALRIRDFAVRELALPDNRSYRSYADLGRAAAVWNVVAAPELSLQLQTWCFPVVGCVGYRGYYDRTDAEAEAAALRTRALEVSVYPVPAYSTLGKLDWLGGDPVLNTFVHWPEGELARLVFHELAHQVVYAAGDTTFNESFATAVERLGVQRWLAAHAGEAARREYAALEARREDFRALTGRTRAQLQALYASAGPEADKRARKAEILAAMRADHARLKAERWGGFAGYDGWFERANNASLGVLAAYNAQVPDFERLFEREGRDFGRFYAAVRRLAALPAGERHATLAAP
ncbi:MAG TPA: aminopeptidase [Burkholderiaceae bacterium]|nr:aminopeptidase [Burkholderiaceae bacterium]